MEVVEAAHSTSVESFWFDEVKPPLAEPLTEASHLKFHVSPTIKGSWRREVEKEMKQTPKVVTSHS